MTTKQKKDLETIEYFIPKCMEAIKITYEDRKLFLEYSEKGLHKDKIDMTRMTSNGLNALIEGKRWRGIHIHELYEKGIIEGSMPYYVILGGLDKPIPRSVVDFLKKEMFQGQCADLIETIYKKILDEYN